MNLANTSFMILASILVLFMTPGLAFFLWGPCFKAKCGQHDVISFCDDWCRYYLLDRDWLPA